MLPCWRQDALRAHYGIKSAYALRLAQEALGHPELQCPPPCRDCGVDVHLDIPPFRSRVAFSHFITAAWLNARCSSCSAKRAAEQAEAESSRLEALEAERQKLRVRFGAQYVRDCPDCSGVLYFRKGRHAGSMFIACSSWPSCQHREPVVASAAVPPPDLAEIERAKAAMAAAPKCPKCGAVLRLINGSRGPFIGCTAYPRCRYTESIPCAPPVVAGEDEIMGRFE
jgi:ssDNA-binding Zn-finger/Zn-ribbon topoisomerase 1